ncbi:MAG: D-inositol-3-phosphate glycosyltransferase [Pedosphaera sp.]|nr:D-inositol-3-phosphate glycosyltransferase [Pedosphaera sp.]
MKILLDCQMPFMLAHGGAQIQIEQTKAALEKIGVNVEYLRWWDATQTGDVLHHFARIPTTLLRLAQAKGMKVVIADLLTEQGSRPRSRLMLQKWVSRIIERTLPSSLVASFNWECYRQSDACLALTSYEAQLMNYMFGAPPEKTHVVPNGVEEVFLQSRPATRGQWLVCTATITERKRVVELAEAAVLAQTPLWVVGRAYSDSDPYAKRFLQLARENPKILRFEGAITDRSKMAEVYREARGFVLLSSMESLSLSALEAAACECPLLLSDLPWAKTVFGESVSYCPITTATAQTASAMRRFYDAAPKLKPPAKPLAWTDVAHQLKTIYESLLKTSR